MQETGRDFHGREVQDKADITIDFTVASSYFISKMIKATCQSNGTLKFMCKKYQGES